MRSRYKWSQDDLWIIEEMVSWGATDVEIGRRLRATALAVNIARKRHGILSRRKALLTARGVARCLGIPCGDKTITWWIKAGYLKARKGQRCGLNRMWYVKEEALLSFLEQPRYWHLWEPARLEPRLRAWVAEIRDGVRFLTTGEVAARFYVRDTTVNSWIHKGYLSAVRRGNWLIREDSLVGFVPPCERPRAKTS